MKNGLTRLEQSSLKKMALGKDVTNEDIVYFSTYFSCMPEVIAEFLQFKYKPVKVKDSELDLLKSELKSANENIKKMQIKLDANKKKTFTGKQLWDVYSKAVGGKTFDGKVLPLYSGLGTQQRGWMAVTGFVNQ